MKKYENHPGLQGLSLGQSTEYRSNYSPELLEGVPRSLNRQELGIVESQPFTGCDIWNAYELSWLNAKGKPVVALARISVDASSANIVESKSFKLYLNSFNQTKFASHEDVSQTMIRDLSAVAGVEVSVTLIEPNDSRSLVVDDLPGQCLDGLDIDVSSFELNPSLLTTDASFGRVSQTLHSHLLKSNCLITNQPDWASVIIQYQGVQIDHESLLRYLISFRLHNEFHEQCVERIFTDVLKYCQPECLSVQALYTRRGGLDINPFRSSVPGSIPPVNRINRQ